jgi:hypothetical protein
MRNQAGLRRLVVGRDHGEGCDCPSLACELGQFDRFAGGVCTGVGEDRQTAFGMLTATLISSRCSSMETVVLSPGERIATIASVSD